MQFRIADAPIPAEVHFFAAAERQDHRFFDQLIVYLSRYVTVRTNARDFHENSAKKIVARWPENERALKFGDRDEESVEISQIELAPVQICSAFIQVHFEF